MELGNWKSSTALPTGQAKAVLGVANGWTSKEIGKFFGISPNTVNASLNQVREKLNGDYDISGKRGWIISESIRNGWLSPLMVIICMASVLSGIVSPDIEIRRSSNRLSGRTPSGRMVRTKKGREALDLDFEFSDSTPELLLAYFEGQNQETLAPWSSTAMPQGDFLENSERVELWRSQIAVLAQAA